MLLTLTSFIAEIAVLNPTEGTDVVSHLSCAV